MLTIRTGTRETAVHRKAIEGHLDGLDNLLHFFALEVTEFLLKLRPGVDAVPR